DCDRNSSRGRVLIRSARVSSFSYLTRNSIARTIHARKMKSRTRNKLSATNARNLRTLVLLSVFEAEDIGARIRQARGAAGLTQVELAELIGVSTRSEQGYELGEVIPYRHMRKLAAV